MIIFSNIICNIHFNEEDFGVYSRYSQIIDYPIIIII